jgi:excisionase family DNA binding protein
VQLKAGALQVALDGKGDAPSRHDDGMKESLLTAHEVAELLGVPTSWVYEQSRAGRIPTVTLGRYRRYRRAAIEAWLAELEAEGLNGGQKRQAV